MNYETPNNETEILSDDERLRDMCRTLRKAEAPKDFDFKLKARLAGAKANDFQPRLVPALLRYALPALGLILVFGLLVYNGGFLSANDSPVAGNSFAPPSTTELPHNSAVASFTPTAQTPDTNTAVFPVSQDTPKPFEIVARQPKKPAVGAERRPKESLMGGSTDISQKNAPLIKPENIMPRSSVPPTSQGDVESSNPIPVKAVLSQNGINADFENGKWTVRSVTPNSLGDSSGVKQNDVIEEIDSQPVSAGTVFNKIVNGKTITVTRNGQKSVIRLLNKQ